MASMRVCSKCGKRKDSIKGFHRKGTKHERSCKECEAESNRIYRENNQREIKEKKRLYRIEHAEEIRKHKRETFKKWFDERLNKVVEGYGGKCKMCGESRKEALVLHHRKRLNGRRPNVLAHWKWIIDNKFPKQIQLLCGTCHTILHRKGGGSLNMAR